MKQAGQFLRRLVAGVDARVPLINGRHRVAVNFDNAATTPPFRSVMKEIEEFVPWYSSVHRGAGYKSVISSNRYEAAREIVREFVNADPKRDTVIFTKGTTEAINILAYKLAEEDRERVVLTTEMEHLANDLPWRYCCKRDCVSVDAQGRLDLNELEAKLVKYQGKVGLVAVTGASNVTGYINPVHQIARMAHAHGAEILVDGAQWVPHCPVDMRPFGAADHIDYLAFSAHKMYAPFGAGALIGRKDTFDRGVPVCKGGGTVNLVTHSIVDWAESPQRDEAGTPNAMGVVALAAAVKMLHSLRMETLYRHERLLIAYAIDGLKRIPGITLFGDSRPDEQRVSLVSFNTEGIHHLTVAKILSYEAGIAVRTGLFCAHPYVQKLLRLSGNDLEYIQEHLDSPLPGLVRISFGLYNNLCEISEFLNVLAWIMRNRKYLIQKYDKIDERTGDLRWLPTRVHKQVP